MSVATSLPPPPPKKRGLGCLGCGCLVLALLFLLVVGLIVGGAYLSYTKALHLTSTTPAAIPEFNGTDDLYNSSRQKMETFGQALNAHQQTTLQLNSDEINTLLARNPDVMRNHMHFFVTLTGDEGRVQASVPTDQLTRGFLTGRFINFDTTFTVFLDQSAHTIIFTPKSIQFGDQTLLGTGTDSPDNQAFMRSFTPAFNQAFNSSFRSTVSGGTILEQARSVEIKDGQLVIQTQ